MAATLPLRVDLAVPLSAVEAIKRRDGIRNREDLRRAVEAEVLAVVGAHWDDITQEQEARDEKDV